MNKEKAIELIQSVNKAISRTQIEALISSEIAKSAGLLTEESAAALVIQNLGVKEPANVYDSRLHDDVHAPTAMSDRMRQVLSEPDKSGLTYLKPDKVHIGDMVKIESVALEDEHEIDTDHGPVTIPTRPTVTGGFIPLGTKGVTETVSVSLNKTAEKRLFKLWGSEWVGKTLMVSNIVTKNIRGQSATWIDWVGLP